MKRSYTSTQVPQPLAVLRRAGYAAFRDPNTGEESFILRLGSGYYPRYHLYVEIIPGGYSFNLHLDQKQASYEGASAHNGEYNGPIVEKELERIDKWARAVYVELMQKPAQEAAEAKAKRGLFGGLFSK